MLPDNVGIKYATYTLYCSQMLRHLPALDQAVLGTPEPDVLEDSCLALFNWKLSEFFDGKDYATVAAAAKNLGLLLLTGVNTLAYAGPSVSSVFASVVDDAVAQAPTWDFANDVNQYHQQGRMLAQKFFQNTPFADTKNNLPQIAGLTFEYGGSDSSGQPPNVNMNLGFRVAPMATYHLPGPAGGSQPTQIVLRVAFDNNFFLYLAYPFLFLHEYTAHIFSNDLKNAAFNDGWMLFAASGFLRSDWQNSSVHPLHANQVWVFHEKLLHKIEGTPRHGHDLARRLSALLETQGKGLSFESMTYELAAFVPSTGEKKFWPSQLLTALGLEFKNNKTGLRAKIEAATDLRNLFASLNVLPPPWS